jgi:cytochrome c-type biogenesis protein CcmF
MLFAAWAGITFKADYDVTLKTGDASDLTDPLGHRWKFISQGFSTAQRRNTNVLSLGLEAWRDGKLVQVMRPEIRTYFNARGEPIFDPTKEAATIRGANLDTYVVLDEAHSADTAELRVAFNPLVSWVWIGGFILAIGGLIVMWPQAHRAPPARSVAVPALREGAELARLAAAIRDDS